MRQTLLPMLLLSALLTSAANTMIGTKTLTPTPEVTPTATVLPEFQGETLDPELLYVTYHYAKINSAEDEIAGLYYDAGKASVGLDPAKIIPFGNLRYVSYTERNTIDGAVYVKNKEGMWLRASPAETPSNTTGFTFSGTPDLNFGWVVEDCNAWAQSSYKMGNTNDKYKQGEVLQFTSTVKDKETTWYQIGPDKWLDQRRFRAAFIGTQPPAEVDRKRWIEIDLSQEVLLVYEENELVYTALIASGTDAFTRSGVFKIEKKLKTEDMTGSFKADRSDYYYLEDVPFTMYYDELRAIHGVYWPARFGFEQSHGCINMSIGDAHWLFNWAKAGDPVWVHD